MHLLSHDEVIVNIKDSFQHMNNIKIDFESVYPNILIKMERSNYFANELLQEINYCKNIIDDIQKTSWYYHTHKSYMFKVYFDINF